MKALIFDFDGLIMDTETRQYEVLQELFAEHGSELPLHVWQQEIGTSTGFSPVDYLFSQTGRSVEAEAFNQQLEQRFLERLAQESARPGVKSYLTEAKKQGLLLGLASSSSYEWVSTHLRNLRLMDYFSCIRTSNDVDHVKPDPALYVQTAACLGVRAEECLVFEDSANGALAAARAGMRCVIVPNQVTADLEFGKVERRIVSMEEVPLASLLKDL
ncbi:HAD family hydrolase [Salibacterium aidingense]|uniref:HAD family hydrolase n=1 Tax=Salibacterium aidingense TaxID=384933 RepID=UPI000405AAFE|nr:HAD-IA family hydrolase [Salibacterium aidingense]